MNGVLEDLLRHQRARAVLRDRRSTVAARDAARATLGLPAKVCGTRDRYVNDGCRCPACRAANTEYHRIYRGRIRQGHLAVLCWCESTVVVAPGETVRAGGTVSCGRRGCEGGP